MKRDTKKELLRDLTHWAISFLAAVLLLVICNFVYQASVGEVYTATAPGFGGNAVADIVVYGRIAGANASELAASAG